MYKSRVTQYISERGAGTEPRHVGDATLPDIMRSDDGAPGTRHLVVKILVALCRALFHQRDVDARNRALHAHSLAIFYQEK